MENVFSEEPEDGPPEPLEVILTPSILATTHFVGVPAPAVDFDDEARICEHDIGSRPELLVHDLDLGQPPLNARSPQELM